MNYTKTFIASVGLAIATATVAHAHNTPSGYNDFCMEEPHNFGGGTEMVSQLFNRYAETHEADLNLKSTEIEFQGTKHTAFVADITGEEKRYVLHIGSSHHHICKMNKNGYDRVMALKP